MKSYLLLVLLSIGVSAQSLITTPTPTPASPADARASQIRSAFAAAAHCNLSAYKAVRDALNCDNTAKAAVLTSLGVTDSQLLQISAALRQAMSLTDSSLAAQFDAITVQTSPTPTPSP